MRMVSNSTCKSAERLELEDCAYYAQMALPWSTVRILLRWIAVAKLTVVRTLSRSSYIAGEWSAP